MLKHAKGNLIDMAEQGLFDIIVHGCNCQNTMGSGIAKEIRERYPIAYLADSQFGAFAVPINLLGNFSVAQGAGSPEFGHRFSIVNAYTQVDYNKKGEEFIDRFEYDSFKLILRKLASSYPDKRFGFPYIGMGLAGGNGIRIIGMLEDFGREVKKTGGSVTLVEFA